MPFKACTFVSSPLMDFSFGADYENYKCIMLKLQLAQYINDVYVSGVRTFYSICEQGVDLWAAEIVTYIMRDDPSTKLFCIVPYEDQAAKWDPAVRDLYYNVHQRSTDVTIMNTHYKKNCIYEAYLAAIERSDKVFASLVGKSSEEIKKYPCFECKDVYCFNGRY